MFFSSVLRCTVHFIANRLEKVRVHLHFWSDRRVPRADCIGVSLTGKERQKHPIVTGPEAPCILGIDYLRRGHFRTQKGISGLLA